MARFSSPLWSFHLKVVTVIISSQIKESSWSVVQDLKAHCADVTWYEEGH